MVPIRENMNDITSSSSEAYKYYNNSRNNGINPARNGWGTFDSSGTINNTLYNVLTNCVGYASGRFNEIIDVARKASGDSTTQFKYKFNVDAENFITQMNNSSWGSDLSTSKTNPPKRGAIVVWGNGSTSGYGHVSIVEEVLSETKIYTSDSNWGGTTLVVNRTRNKGTNNNWGYISGSGPSYEFLGFIYPPASLQSIIDRQISDDKIIPTDVDGLVIEVKDNKEIVKYNGGPNPIVATK